MSEAGRSIGSFVETIDRATSIDEVGAVFLAATAHFGFEYVALFACPHPGDPLETSINFTRIPAAWLEHYFDNNYHKIDPVFDAVQHRVTPFSWNDPAYRRGLTPAQKAMLAESDEAGLMGGLAIPIGGPGASQACCTLLPARQDVDPASYAIVHSLAVFAHTRARGALGAPLFRPATRLPKRERECLLLAGQGKSDWVIGEMLGLSERTVHHTIERAKRRFGVGTRVQAIVHAIAAGEFSATDAIG